MMVRLVRTFSVTPILQSGGTVGMPALLGLPASRDPIAVHRRLAGLLSTGECMIQN